MATIYPVIMSGGSGTRLWPLSRKDSPKQYQRLVKGGTMLEETLKRVTPNHARQCNVAAPVIICANGHQDRIAAQAKNAGIALDAIILEPMARNTAPVAAVAAQHVAAKDPEGLILLLPADHYVPDVTGFWTAVQKGIAAAQENYLITLGIQPTAPETGYGYIERGPALNETAYKVARFVEKPDTTTAEEYLANGNFFWNAGIFLYQAASMLSEFETHAPQILSASQKAYENATTEGQTLLLCADSFAPCMSDSIDYAIMEKTNHAAIVAPVNVGWNDIGAWSAVSDVIGHAGDAETSGEVISVDSTNTYIRSDGPLVAAIGVKDLIIVAQDDAILVTRNDRTQDVKKIVDTLKEKGRDDLL